MKTLIFRYLDFSSRNRILVISGAMMAILMLVFHLIPVIGKRLIDLLPYYSYEAMISLLTSYGEKGMHLHVLATTILDSLFPIVYVTFHAGLIYRLRPRPWYLALAPVCLGLTDICENTLIVAMLLQYPDVCPRVVNSASMLTFTKHQLTSLTLLIMLVLITMKIVRRLKRQVHGKQ